MPFLKEGLTLLALITIGLIVVLTRHVDEPHGRAWKLLAFGALFVLPALLSGLGLAQHMEQSKSTEFCLSCHVMEPYGKSLLIDDSEYLPAQHFQNLRIPEKQACYTCHTQYAMFGDMKTKIGGLKHLWVYYVGTMPEKIELYQPYQNRECLHCHDEARSFAENEMHVDFLGELRTGEASCLDCHEFVHDAENLDDQTFWDPPVGGE